ncbi:hypothetical protein [Marinitenerispora sediminis]|uniref:Uncharacterized protein n=1 Tax=Marinitenerispora sediminis TaxID=1931232 RepID=A0A368TDC5_9ACTN|nr:hypothetical protein [Marinitenerispora sediminis]RCV53391.1 hypothetical protein DEF28_10555 [Marinitenerispora sediminis]RCV58413.1 hypothetical protein DEF23_08815 [Marinitenerispora sediminis]RCV61806.1 hypothetical protein DEF24_03555 [Marinitenerispora sediminis]
MPGGSALVAGRERGDAIAERPRVGAAVGEPLGAGIDSAMVLARHRMFAALPRGADPARPPDRLLGGKACSLTAIRARPRSRDIAATRTRTAADAVLRGGRPLAFVREAYQGRTTAEQALNLLGAGRWRPGSPRGPR